MQSRPCGRKYILIVDIQIISSKFIGTQLRYSRLSFLWAISTPSTNLVRCTFRIFAAPPFGILPSNPFDHKSQNILKYNKKKWIIHKVILKNTLVRIYYKYLIIKKIREGSDSNWQLRIMSPLWFRFHHHPANFKTCTNIIKYIKQGVSQDYNQLVLAPFSSQFKRIYCLKITKVLLNTLNLAIHNTDKIQ